MGLMRNVMELIAAGKERDEWYPLAQQSRQLTNERVQEARQYEAAGDSEQAGAILRGVARVYEQTLPPQDVARDRTRLAVVDEIVDEMEKRRALRGSSQYRGAPNP